VGDRNIDVFNAADRRQQQVLGRIAAHGPEDELRDTRFLVVEAIDGKDWHVALGRIHSSALHRMNDPSASKFFIEAHKRRLEALRRAGIVMRQPDGAWRIGKEYLQQAASFEAARAGDAKIDVKSWIDVSTQIEHRGSTWLDDLDSTELSAKGFGADVKTALVRRAAFLKREGLWSDEAGGLEPSKRDRLANEEKRETIAREQERTGKAFRAIGEGGSFAGIYERPVNLAQGRFALVARSKEFTLVPWRMELERHRGVSIVLKRTGKGIDWTLGKQRGLGR